MASETTTYTVTGMSCEHCRSAVYEEVSQVDGVEAVQVDLASGRLVVVGRDVQPDRVREAVQEAGYEVAA
jgi:copper chaperone CopZ